MADDGHDPDSDDGWRTPPLLILPAIYIAAILLSALLSPATPGAAYYRVIPICPVAGVVGMAFDNEGLMFAVFLLVGTPWWYFIGRIAWRNYTRQKGALHPLVAAAIALFTSFLSTAMSLDVFKRDFNDGVVEGMVFVQYFFIALLCLGALVSTLSALATALDPGKE
jgi:hypothetical protein